MPKFNVIVEPEDKTAVGWDVQCFSWNKDQTRQVFHIITWEPPQEGKFEGTSADLPIGIYGVRCGAIGSGRNVDVSVSPSVVIQPQAGNWPMTTEVASGSSTQKSRTWYFQNGEVES